MTGVVFLAFVGYSIFVTVLFLMERWANKRLRDAIKEAIALTERLKQKLATPTEEDSGWNG